jgi:hypothetical protein
MTRLSENELEFLSRFHDVSDLDCFHCYNLLGNHRIILFGENNKVAVINELKKKKQGWFMDCSSCTFIPDLSDKFSNLNFNEKDEEFDFEERINLIFHGQCDFWIDAELGDNIIEVSRQATLNKSKVTFYWNGVDKVSFSDRNQRLFNLLLRKKRIEPHLYLSKKAITSHIFRLLQ